MTQAQETCSRLHIAVHRLWHFRFPAIKGDVPESGVYFIFESGESAHSGPRIVRIGSHTGDRNLPNRLVEHTKANKDRSVFRKNIGRALLNKASDRFLDEWEIDLTTRNARQHHGGKVDQAVLSRVEAEVSRYIVDSLTAAVVRIDDKATRLRFESHAIATVAQCPACSPSATWLGRYSPAEKIRDSGLWQTQHLTGSPLSPDDLTWLEKYSAQG